MVRRHKPGCACCGADADPLDLAFGLPDEVLKVGKGMTAAERQRRIFVSPDLVGLDTTRGRPGGRHFLRGLFRVPVHGLKDPAAKFTFGTWFEITYEDALGLAEVWDDPAGWMALELKAKIANTIPDAGTNSLGTKVVLGAFDPKQRLEVTSADDPGLARLLSEGWSKERYEAFARLVGIL